MDLLTLKKLILSLERDVRREEIGTFFGVKVNLATRPTLSARFKEIIDFSSKLLPEHKTFLVAARDQFERTSGNSIKARSVLAHILDLINLQMKAESRMRELRVFGSAEEKLKQAGSSFQREDYPSCMNSLNTALELLLKDKLGIPSTIRQINCSKIIDICVKDEVGPFSHLSEAKKRVCLIDNKVKHEAYLPSRVECIDAMKVVEELVSRLRGVDLKLTGETRKKILSEL